jgi:insulysin
MLFLGTKKYPRDTEFNEFLARNGGHNNAFTSMEHTNYHFDILAPQLEEALDRFGQFFTNPLFNEDAGKKDISFIELIGSSK